MVVVLATGADVQVALHRLAQRLEKVAEHLGGSVAHIFAGKGNLPAKIDAAAEVQEHHSLALVHRESKAVAGNAALVAQSPLQGLSKADGHIFHSVVLVYLEVALGLYLQADAAVVRNLVQHMVKEVQAGGDAALQTTVQIHRDLDLRLAGVALYCGAAHSAAQEPGNLTPGLSLEDSWLIISCL